MSSAQGREQMKGCKDQVSLPVFPVASRELSGKVSRMNENMSPGQDRTCKCQTPTQNSSIPIQLGRWVI